MINAGGWPRKPNVWDAKPFRISLPLLHPIRCCVGTETRSLEWDSSDRRSPGRPPIMAELGKLIVKMAIENPSWGYTRIQGALANLRHVVGRGTIANVLKAHGIEPAPQRGKRTSRSTFLKAIGR